MSDRSPEIQQDPSPDVQKQIHMRIQRRGRAIAVGFCIAIVIALLSFAAYASYMIGEAAA